MSLYLGVLPLAHTKVSPDDIVRLRRAVAETVARRTPGGSGVDSEEIPVYLTPQNGPVLVWKDWSPAPSFSMHREQKWGVFCDGRIDNRPELISLLSLTASETREWNPADWIRAAYEHWGETCCDHLIGDYSFAIWDLTGERSLTCVRDPGKMRPFYWAIHQGRFYWSSCPETLATGAGLSMDWDLDYLTTFMATPNLKNERSPYRSVQRLPGGQRLSVRRDGTARAETWWELPAADRYRAGQWEEAAVEELQALLQRVVSDRLPTDGEQVSIAFSGGIDSAAVARYALESHGDIAGITVALPALPESDESPHASRIAAALGLPLTVVENRAGYGSALPEASMALAEPSMLAGYWSMYETLRATMSGGTASATRSILLTGVGGDELFHARLSFIGDLVRQGPGAWPLLWSEASRWRRQGVSGARFLRKILEGISTPGLREGFPWLRRTPMRFTPPRLPRYQHPLDCSLWRAFVAMEQPIIPLAESLFAPAGVELRHPLIDRRLIEFAARLPHEARVSTTRTNKPILRRACADRLPNHLYGERADLAAYTTSGICENWHTLMALLENPPTLLEQLAEVPQLRRAVTQLRRARRGPYLWPSVSLAFWLSARQSGGPACSTVRQAHEKAVYEALNHAPVLALKEGR